MSNRSTDQENPDESGALVAVRLPKPFLELIDDHVQTTDSDRSKFARAAFREKLDRERKRSMRSGR